MRGTHSRPTEQCSLASLRRDNCDDDNSEADKLRPRGISKSRDSVSPSRVFAVRTLVIDPIVSVPSPAGGDVRRYYIRNTLALCAL